jgi:hypothetical protein
VAQRKRTNIDLQNNTQKTKCKHEAPRISEVNSASEGLAGHAALVISSYRCCNIQDELLILNIHCITFNMLFSGVNLR